MLDSIYSTMYAYFVNLSIMTRIESYSTPIIRSFKRGSLTTKSKAIDFYSLGSIGVDLIWL